MRDTIGFDSALRKMRQRARTVLVLPDSRQRASSKARTQHLIAASLADGAVSRHPAFATTNESPRRSTEAEGAWIEFTVPRPLRRTYIVLTFSMNALRFEWDELKAQRNRWKHGVSFEEAQTAFADDFAILLADSLHSYGEERFYLLGLSAGLRLLVVIHAYRAGDEVVRLISARTATPSERAQYDARWPR